MCRGQVKVFGLARTVGTMTPFPAITHQWHSLDTVTPPICLYPAG